MAVRKKQRGGAAGFQEAWGALLGRVGRDLTGLRGAVDERVHRAMARLRLPSRAEVVEVTRRLAVLSRRVEEMERMLDQRRRGAPD